MYLTLEQTAERLGRSKRQVKYLIKTGVLEPANKDTYRRDGGYRFTTDTVDSVKKHLNPEGLTLKQAANILDITPQHLNKLALEGDVNSTLILIGNRSERRFKESDIEQLKDNLKRKVNYRVEHLGNKLHLYNNSLRLFQKILYKGEWTRVVSTEPIVLLLPNGSLVSPELKEIVSGTEAWEHKPYITKKGFLMFLIPIPRAPEHYTYELLYKLIELLGVKNVQVFEREDGDFLLRCRQAKLKLDKKYVSQLKRYLIQGDVSLTEDEFVLLSTGFVSQYVYLPKELFNQVVQEASTLDTSVQELLVKYIQQGIHSKE